ncbi:hypothetical protein J3F83DRAFT_729191 [Trichoderma novae-zelandiae]
MGSDPYLAFMLVVVVFLRLASCHITYRVLHEAKFGSRHLISSTFTKADATPSTPRNRGIEIVPLFSSHHLSREYTASMTVIIQRKSHQFIIILHLHMYIAPPPPLVKKSPPRQRYAMPKARRK